MENIISRELLTVMASLTGTLIGVATGYLFGKGLNKAKSGILVAFAAGMMIGCSLVLIGEGVHRSSWSECVVAVSAGVVLMLVLDRICTEYLDESEIHFSGVSDKQTVRIVVMLVGLLVHSIGEGLSLGMSAADSSSTSLIVASSLAVHNVPETAALLVAFRAKGLSEPAAIGFAIVSNLPQSVVALPVMSFFSNSFEAIKYGMGVSAGCMLYAVVRDIYPEAVVLVGRPRTIVYAALASFLVILSDAYSHIHIR